MSITRSKPKKPSQAQLRLLAGVADELVRRTGAGWMVSWQRATAAEGRNLAAFRANGWITANASYQLDALESIPATITNEGLAVITQHWPEWKPRKTAAMNQER